MKWRRKLWWASYSAILLVGFGVAYRCIPPRLPNNPAVSTDPKAVLAEADRLFWLGNLASAGPLYERAERLFHTVQDRPNEIYARVGRLRSDLSGMRFGEVSRLLAQQLSDPSVLANPSLRLWCLTAKGYIDFDIDTESAKQDWIEALRLAIKLGDKRWTSRARGELGLIAFVEGDTSRAVSLVGNALWAAYRSGDVGAEVEYLDMAGTGFVEERRFSEALPFFRLAIAMSKITPDTGFPYMAYEGRAACLIGTNKLGEARTLLQDLRSRAQAGHRRVEEARIVTELGDTSLAVQNIEEAKSEYEEAGRLFQDLGVSRGLDEAMFKLATIYRRQGHLDAAEKALRIGLPSVRHMDLYYLPRELTAIAELEAAQKRPKKADQLFQQAEDVIDGLMANLHSDFEMAAVSGAMSETYLEHFKLAVQQGNVRRAFHILERVRSSGARNLGSGAYTSEGETASTARVDDAIASVQRTLLNTEDDKQRSGLLDELTAYERVRAFVDNESAHDDHGLPQHPAWLESVQRLLGKDELLAEYVLDEPISFCISVTKRKAHVLILASGKKRIEDLTTSFLKQLRAGKSDDRAASELYDALLGPLLKAFPKRRLVISADGILLQLPFEALRRADGDLLIRSKIVSYVPSATILLGLRNTKSAALPHLLLAVGGIAYQPRQLPPGLDHANSLVPSNSSGLSEIRADELVPLPESRDELVSIARLFHTDAVVLLGKEATESALKAQPLSDYRVIHFAVHAFPDPQHPQRAALVLGTDSTTADDGLLQASEISRLHLRADLVTLSGCQTGIGALLGEAGMASLEQAFLTAGARSVLTSLWNLEDHSTSALVRSFYSHLVRGDDKAMALANAKRDILERYGDDVPPYYWAGLVLVGESREKISVSR